ncbi:MAG TPA: hypothetical protein VGQ65_11570 [Thermoanaerobaculia bacterium]|nr:hypothetical protein [Thermoanaerobaculia bacterium]
MKYRNAWKSRPNQSHHFGGRIPAVQREYSARSGSTLSQYAFQDPRLSFSVRGRRREVQPYFTHEADTLQPFKQQRQFMCSFWNQFRVQTYGWIHE